MNNKNSIENGNGKSEKHNNETILSYMCPTCKQLLGKEQFEKVTHDLRKIKEEESKKIIESYEEKSMQSKKTINELHYEIRTLKDDIETRANELASIRIDSEVKKERERIEGKYEQQLYNASNEIRELKEEYYEQTKAEIEDQYRTKIKTYELKIGQIDKAKNDLESKVKNLEQTIESIPSWLKGNVGEFILMDQLKKEFPNDHIEGKKVGQEMADIIQHISLETGERIPFRIVYDSKVKEKLTSKDIEKAQNYKNIHKTEYSIIVMKKCSRQNLIEERDGILIVHVSILTQFVKMIRKEIIKISRLSRSDEEKLSQQRSLYNYIISPECANILERARKVKSGMNNLQTKEEKFHNDLWDQRNELNESWYELINCHNQRINDIIYKKEKE
jgi:uncharacterized protein YlaI